MKERRFLLLAIASTLILAIGCGHDETRLRPGDRVERRGDEIVVCGQLFHTGTRVVLWTDPGGYDAYRPEPRFPTEMNPKDLAAWKFKPTLSPTRDSVDESARKRILDNGWTLDDLRACVDQFVMHFDVCGTSRRCFKVLHDQRALSVQFMLDVDGTLYQTMDLKDRAYHAKQANDRSIGVEIAHIGAYTNKDDKIFKEWYQQTEKGPLLRFPPETFPNGTGIRTTNFIGRPARPNLITGSIHGTPYYQYDFTNEQYATLGKLVATIHEVLPKVRLDAPRDRDGRVLMRALSDSEFAAYSGLLGHYHVTDQKNDPGPAFDWERVLRAARE